MNSIITVLQGIVMGIVETIPGVSGSTLALIMGIYEDFLDVLHQVSDCAKSLIKVITFKEKPLHIIDSIKLINFKFAVKLFLGMLIGIAVFSHILSFMLETFPIHTYAFFFGLMLFSIPIPFKKIEKVSPKVLAIILIIVMLAFIFFGLKPQVNEHPSQILLFISGVLGISGLILPGVSGSFVLLVIGVYEYIFGIVKNITTLNFNQNEIINLVIFMSGLIVGFVTFVRVLKYLFKRHNDSLMAILTGILIASLRIIWPYMDTTSSESVDSMTKITPFQLSLNDNIAIIIIIILTGGVVILLQKMDPKKDKTTD